MKKSIGFSLGLFYFILASSASANNMTGQELCENTIIAGMKITKKSEYSGMLNIKIVGFEVKYDNETTIDTRSLLDSSAVDSCLKCDIIKNCRPYLPIFNINTEFYCQKQCDAQVKKYELENTLLEIQIERLKAHNATDSKSASGSESPRRVRNPQSKKRPKSPQANNNNILAFDQNELPRQVRNSSNLCLDHTDANIDSANPIKARPCQSIAGQQWYRQNNMLRTPQGYCLEIANNLLPGGRLRLTDCPQRMASWTISVGQPLQTNFMCVIPVNSAAPREIALEPCGKQSKRLQMFGP